eukprot:4771012-Heterocapsa_arctica.AAC.1
MATRVMTDKEINSIDSRICKYGRVMMLGTAHTEEEGKHKALTSTEVMKYLHYAGTRTELWIRRLRMYRTIARQRNRFEQLWAALLGELIGIA